MIKMSNDNNTGVQKSNDEISSVADKRDVYFKVLVVGSASVGKTSLLLRYVEERFETTYKSTIGASCYNKALAWSPDTNVHLQFWDLAGQDRLNHQSRVYYRDAAGALCVCDASKLETRKEVLAWKRLVDENCLQRDGSLMTPPSVMVVNKMDLYGTLDDPWIDNEPSRNNKNCTGIYDESFYGVEDPDCLLATPKTTYENLIPEHRQRYSLKGYSDSINCKVNEVSMNSGFYAGVPTSVKDNTGIDLAIEILVTEMLRRYDSDEQKERRRKIELEKDPAFQLGHEREMPVSVNKSRCNYC
jgi:small GTP-binding protein